MATIGRRQFIAQGTGAVTAAAAAFTLLGSPPPAQAAPSELNEIRKTLDEFQKANARLNQLAARWTVPAPADQPAASQLLAGILVETKVGFSTAEALRQTIP